ncbi:hypothetical protein HFV01_09255 [Limnospira fusiformis SAG 85.79]|nr:hypothetical protein HFV01_09255 [Limnospira fusiformis SAG 85.79]RAQ39581.1 hypothetical protein B9S53_20910 [Arthrospira sp. O9.13F]
MCRCLVENPTIPLTLLGAACQPVSLLHNYDGSSQTFGFPNHGWLAVVSLLVLGYTSEPSVPRFNPGVVYPKTGGSYRRYSQRNC